MIPIDILIGMHVLICLAGGWFIKTDPHFVMEKYAKIGKEGLANYEKAVLPKIYGNFSGKYNLDFRYRFLPWMEASIRLLADLKYIGITTCVVIWFVFFRVDGSSDDAPWIF